MPHLPSAKAVQRDVDLARRKHLDVRGEVVGRRGHRHRVRSERPAIGDLGGGRGARRDLGAERHRELHGEGSQTADSGDADTDARARVPPPQRCGR